MGPMSRTWTSVDRLTSRREFVVFTVSLGLPLQGSTTEPVLRAAIYEWPPFGFRTGPSTVGGALVDWFKELAQTAGLDIRVELTPIARVFQSLGHGGVQLAAIVDTDRFPERVEKIASIGAFPLSVWALNESDIRVRGDLRRRRLAVLRGGSAEELARAEPGVTVVPVTSIGSMVSMLRIQRVDALLITEPALRAHLAKVGDDPFFRVARRVVEISALLSLYADTSIGSSVTDRLKAAAAKLAAGRRYETLMAEHTKLLLSTGASRP